MSTPEIEQLTKKAESGDARAMFVLAQRYRDGDGVTRDYAQFLQWLARLRYLLKFEEMKPLLSFQDRKQTELDSFVNWLSESAESGDANSMHFLSDLYRIGIGFEKNEKQWIAWLKKAAESGSVTAMHDLAFIYFFGIGVPEDKNQYFFWIQKAAATGHKESMAALAYAYREGFGVIKDPEQYIEWLLKAIYAGDPISMRILALDYRDGFGVTDDHQQSIHWFFCAAEAGDVFALYEIRRMYRSREFERHCLDDDIAWLTRAAVIDDGNLYAELAIKHWTRNAEDDHDKFRHWLEQGERQGNVRAFIFGSLLRLSVSQSLDRATVSDLYQALFELSGKVEAIKQQHLIRNGDKEIPEVAHFTTLEALHSMLPVSDRKTTEAECYTGQSRALRLYHIAYMNDPQEGRRLLDLQHADAKLLNEFFATAESGNNHNFLWENQEISVYCGSFTLRVDRLDLWRAYGRDGAGYCVVIPARAFQPAPESNPSHVMRDVLRRGDEALAAAKISRSQAPALYRILYKQAEAKKTLVTLKPVLKALKRIKQTINNLEVSKEISSLVRIVVSDILYLYKNEEYASEEEARMIVARKIADNTLKLDDRQPPRIYVETDAFLFQDEGTRIIIGPKVADKVAAELNLKYRLARHDLLKTTAVEWSKVKYR
jgi:TPR repeat protein